MLDVSIRTELLRLMLDLRAERGLTYLFITHDLSLAWVIADRIAVMYLGKIMEIGPAEAVIRSPAQPVHAGARLGLAVTRPADGRRTRAQRTILVGETPDAAHIPTGCRFNPRCPLVVRPLPGRGAAAVRRRWRPGGRVLAGRARAGGSAGAPCRWPTAVVGADARGAGHVTDPFAADAEALVALDLPTIADLLAASARRPSRPSSPLSARPPAGAPHPASGAPTSASATSSRPSGAGSPGASGASSTRRGRRAAPAARPRGLGPAGGRRGAPRRPARPAPSWSTSSSRSAPTASPWSGRSTPDDLDRGPASTRRSGRCASTSSSASGSTTTATTSASCWR